jgi:hypothetical protein
MPTRSRKIRQIIGVLLLLGLTFSPAITTICWHLWHGSKIDYAGVHFAVPYRWSARISSTGIHFEKRPLNVFVGPVLLAWAALAPVPGPPPTSAELEAFYTSFAAIHWTYLLGEQEIQQGPIRVGTADQEAFCMQSVLKDRKDWFHVTCIISRGTWSVDFQGCAKDKIEFFHKVLGLPDVRPPEKRPDRVTK